MPLVPPSASRSAAPSRGSRERAHPSSPLANAVELTPKGSQVRPAPRARPLALRAQRHSLRIDSRSPVRLAVRPSARRYRSWSSISASTQKSACIRGPRRPSRSTTSISPGAARRFLDARVQACSVAAAHRFGRERRWPHRPACPTSAHTPRSRDQRVTPFATRTAIALFDCCAPTTEQVSSTSTRTGVACGGVSLAAASEWNPDEPHTSNQFRDSRRRQR